MQNRSSTGLEGERLAEKFLRKNSYKILDRRFRTKMGELDLVARKGKVIVFVEVRSVSEEDFGYIPAESVRFRKIRHLTKVAQQWIQKKKLRNMEYRFDVITVDFSCEPPVINHFPAAFEATLDF
jgi:putative endonuclease